MLYKDRIMYYMLMFAGSEHSAVPHFQEVICYMGNNGG